MTYTPTTWVEGVTKVGPTNLNKMEQGIAAASSAGLGVVFSLASSSLAGASTITVNETVPVGLASRASLLAIDVPGLACELRRVSQVNDKQFTLNSALTFAHSSSASVFWLPLGAAPSGFWGVKGDNSTDDSAAWQAAVDAAVAAGSNLDSPWIDGGLVASKVKLPIVLENNSCVRNAYFSADAAFPADGNNGVLMSSNGSKGIAFTASSSTDQITLSAAGSATLVVGHPILVTGVSLPSPLVSGHVYFVDTITSQTVFTLAATQGGATINLTTDGSGTFYGRFGALTRCQLDNVLVLGNHVASLNGIVATFQQPDAMRKVRVDTCPGSGLRLPYYSQIGNFYNCEANSCGIGIEIGGTPASVGGAANPTGLNFYDTHLVGNDTAIKIITGTAIGFYGLWMETSVTRGLLLSGPGASYGITLEGVEASLGASVPAVEIDSSISSSYSFSLAGVRLPGTGIFVKDNKRGITLDTTAIPSGMLVRYTQGADQGMAPDVIAQPRWQSKTADYTLTLADYGIGVDATVATRTVTLPSAVGIAGKEYIVKKTDSSANAVTVAASSGQNIEGSASVSLATQWAYIHLISQGAQWRIIT